MRRTALLVVPAAVWFATCTTPAGPAANAAPTDRGQQLYARHCAVCHGADGDGDTPVALFLLPGPNAFRDGLFKLVSTQNGMPTEDDLIATLRRGMPGSTMMSWGWLPDADLRALAQEVQRLTLVGRTESIARTAVAAGQPLTEEQARATAERQLRAGATVDTGAASDPTAPQLAEGERLYGLHCAGCHGQDGRGLPTTRDWPTDGTWLWPRDFTAGYLRGGVSHRDLALRIRAGMPGAHMPPAQLSTAETEALVSFVQGLIPETAADHHAQWRRTLRVPQRQTLPNDDAVATTIEPLRLPLAPLWWRAEAVDEVLVRVAHDGATVLLQLEWADATRSDRAAADGSMGDGAAIQFARSEDPPLFAMGSLAEPVNVWRWHAFDPKETAGMIDLLGARHSGLDVGGATPPRPRTESIELGGIGSAAAATGSGLPLAVHTQWRDGRWTATFRRQLGARSPHEVAIGTGERVLFALAIWDGSIDRSAASKAISTWHVLELQR
ncbi:MAG: c-type cytochrome [Planctomycetes bacterium]|jgi:mono/diheme cytochrome c family protein|nr:c-type cytochrome [Planctomycetota bacterium]